MMQDIIRSTCVTLSATLVCFDDIQMHHTPFAKQKERSFVAYTTPKTAALKKHVVPKSQTVSPNLTTEVLIKLGSRESEETFADIG